MSKDPAFLFYYHDFLVGTDHMTLEQVGAYVKCLCHQANRGSIRKEHMLRICLAQENYDVIVEKFELNGNGEFVNKRLRNEVKRRKIYTESRRTNAYGKGYAKGYANHMETVTETVTEKNNIKETKDTISINKNNRFIVPTPQEIKDYCIERKNNVDSNKFFNFYESKGWMVGRNKMKDWKAAIRNWEGGKGVRVDNFKKVPPNPQCGNCGGTGELYAPGSGKMNPCSCVKG